MPRDGSQNYHSPSPDVQPNTTIASTVYNLFVNDIVQELNTPLPVSRGGTGATTAAAAMATLGGELAGQLVTNYDSFAFVAGSFFSSNATGQHAPVDGHAFAGICYVTDSSNMVLEARDESDTAVPGRVYVREKKAGVWGTWNLDGRTTIGGAEGISGTNADMFFGLNGTAPTSSFIVNTKADVTGTNVLAVTKTGAVQINAIPAGNSFLMMNGPATGAFGNLLFGQKGGKSRWIIQLGSSSPEGGANAGSDFEIDRVADDGTTNLGSAFSILRATGGVAIPGTLGVGGTATFAGISGTSMTISGAAAFGSTLNVTGAILTGAPITAGGVLSAPTLNIGASPVPLTATQPYAVKVAANLNFTCLSSAGAAYFGVLNDAANAWQPMAISSPLTVTAGLTVSNGITVANGSLVVSAGDITAQRSGAPTSGLYYFGNGGTRYIYHDGASFFNFVGGAPASAGGYYLAAPAAATASFVGNSGATYFQFVTGSYLQCNVSTALLSLVLNSAVSASFDAAGNFTTGLNGYKPGGGAWGVSSDVRIKNDLGDYTRGLDDIVQLRPIIYTYKGNDTPAPPTMIKSDPMAVDDGTEKEMLTAPYPNSMHANAAKTGTTFAGLIAQEVEAIFPEMVTKRSAYIDGQPVDDLHDLDTTPLVFALINAVKELKARIEVLEAA